MIKQLISYSLILSILWPNILQAMEPNDEEGRKYPPIASSPPTDKELEEFTGSLQPPREEEVMLLEHLRREEEERKSQRRKKDKSVLKEKRDEEEEKRKSPSNFPNGYDEARETFILKDHRDSKHTGKHDSDEDLPVADVGSLPPESQLHHGSWGQHPHYQLVSVVNSTAHGNIQDEHPPTETDRLLPRGKRSSSSHSPSREIHEIEIFNTENFPRPSNIDSDEETLVDLSQIESGRIRLSQLKEFILIRVLANPKDKLPARIGPLKLGEQEYQDKLVELFQQIKGTSLEEFGQYMGGHVLRSKLYRFLPRQYMALLLAAGMTAGTAAAMSGIVEYSIYNAKIDKFLSHGSKIDLNLAYYINASVGVVTISDSSQFMSELTSKGRGSFSKGSSSWERGLDIVLIPFSTIPAVFLGLIGWLVQKEHMEVTHTNNLWNGYTKFFVITSAGFFPYLTLKSWLMTKAAVRKMIRPAVVPYVKERVRALRYLEEQVDKHLCNDEIRELYQTMRSMEEKGVGNKLESWGNHILKGKDSSSTISSGLLTYLTLCKVSRDKVQLALDFNEEDGQKISRTAKVLSGVGLMGGFGLIFGSVYSVSEDFVGSETALAVALTAGFLGFIPAGLLQKYGLETTLEMIDENVTPFLRGQITPLDLLRDPIKCVKSIAKGTTYAWSFVQNLLTNIAPIGVTLFYLAASPINGDTETMNILGGTLLTLGAIYMINECFTGTADIAGHVIAIGRFIQSVYRKVTSWLCQCNSVTSSRERDWVREKVRESIHETLNFTQEHEFALRELELKIEGHSSSILE